MALKPLQNVLMEGSQEEEHCILVAADGVAFVAAAAVVVP